MTLPMLVWQYCNKIRLIQSKMKNLKYLSLMLLCVTSGLFFTSCSDDDENDMNRLSQNELFLMAGQSAKLIYNGDCTWKSNDPLIAEVDDNGNVTANRIGETMIWANDEFCKVIVTPKYNTYMEPCMEWGTSKSIVKSFMNGFEFVGEDDNSIGYIDYNHNFGYMYMFENNSLYASIVMTNILSYGEEVTDFLLERYVTVSMDNNLILMSSIDGKMAVGIMFESSIMMVAYMPFNTDRTNTESIMSKLSKQIIQNNVIEQESIDIDILNKFKK